MESDLFTFSGDQQIQNNAPLADRLRPRSLDEFVGQGSILAEGRLLRRAIAADRVGNLLLHGPPGVGKTTLARIVACHTRAHFSVLNAVLAGVKDLRSEVDAAKNRINLHGLRTILFIDEVHRFNTAQQDALLPWVENGTLTLIGATTENPYFEVNKALLSRSTLFRFQPLNSDNLHLLLKRALKDKERGYGDKKVAISNAAANHLVDIANGDARNLLNALELAVESTRPNKEGTINIDLAIAEESIQERAILYDKQGDAHFDTISAFIKSIRGSDPDAALFWLARMVQAGENPRFIFRRMLIAAGEDIGLADPQAIVVVQSCAAGFDRVGLPEGLYLLAQATIYLASTEKSNSTLGFFDALRTVREAQKQEIPTHLRDAHRDKDAFGDGIGYRYPHAFAEHWVAQQYLPDQLQGEIFWNPSKQGWEGKKRLEMLERRAAQLAAIAESTESTPFLLTSGPQFSDLDKWVQRQLMQEGERLQELSRQLWIDVPWQRNDRILVIGGHSLLWALTPLRSAPEGGITIICGNSDEKNRISAQLELFDSISKPSLVELTSDSVDLLSKNLEFEWIGGRLHSDYLTNQTINSLWEQITARCINKAGLRFLISFPTVGPAQALRNLIGDNASLSKADNQLFDNVTLAEQNWLQCRKKDHLLCSKLKTLGWSLKSELWSESLTLTIDQDLLNRWFKKEGDYRVFLKENNLEHFSQKLESLFLRNKGKQLPQEISHMLLKGQL